MSDKTIISVTRWQGEEPPTERALRERLRASGHDYYEWGNGPSDTYAVHSHNYDKHLVCLAGGIRFTLPATNDAVDLRPGDELLLPAGTLHGAIVGLQGVRCAEAHL
jgi:mannose-6-phosphate isomerase-like protein (cupin superfamily)